MLRRRQPECKSSVVISGFNPKTQSSSLLPNDQDKCDQASSEGSDDVSEKLLICCLKISWEDGFIVNTVKDEDKWTGKQKIETIGNKNHAREMRAQNNLTEHISPSIPPAVDSGMPSSLFALLG